jgi:hypothetical protein
MLIARQVGLVLNAQTILFYKGLLTIDAVVLRLYPDFDYKKESQRALRLVRMYELEKRFRPGAIIDTALLAQILFGTLPTFIESRLQDYEQGQRQIYRKLNVIPAIGASAMKALAWAAAAAAVVALLDTRGLLGWLWGRLPRESVAPALDVAGAHIVLAVLVTLAASSASRSLRMRSLVKVQREV